MQRKKPGAVSITGFRQARVTYSNPVIILGSRDW